MQAGVGLQGRVDISIKKADGRVLKQRIYNDLNANIHRELADRIDNVGNAYNSTYQPEKIKIYAKGYGGESSGTEDTEFETIALDTKNYSTNVGIDPTVSIVSYMAELKYQVADFLFDANTDDFSGTANQKEADGVNTRISKVQLISQDGTTVLGVARAESESTSSDMGHQDLTGDVGAGNEIDENDKVTITYTITFSSTASVSTGTAWIETLANTVKDAPNGSTTTPDPSIKSVKLIHPSGASSVTITKPDVTGNVGQVDVATTYTYVFIGDPDLPDVGAGGTGVGDIAAVGGTATDPVEFPNISSADAPTGLQVLGVGDMLIGDHTITSGSSDDDIPTWSNGDNVKIHYYIKVSNTESSLTLT